MSYDAWKTRAPYDDEPEMDCDHSEYEVDWEGRATCDYCGSHWWLTDEQLRAHNEAEARWMEEYDRAQQREHSRFWRVVDWLKGSAMYAKRVARRVAHRQPMPLLDDDDIPF